MITEREAGCLSQKSLRDYIFFLFTLANKCKVTSFLEAVERLCFFLHGLNILLFYLDAVKY